MKKSLAILMAAMMAVTAAGCGSKQEETTAADVYKRQGISCSRRISLFQSKVNYRVAVFSKAGSVKRTGFCLKTYPGNIVFLRHWMQNFSHLDCYVKT